MEGEEDDVVEELRLNEVAVELVVVGGSDGFRGGWLLLYCI